MLLKEMLEGKTKEYLLNCARAYKMRNYSRLTKGELAAYVAENLCSADSLRDRLSCMSDEEISIVRKAGIAGQEIPTYKTMYGLRLTCYYLGYYDAASGLFFTYEDVTAELDKIDDEDFKLQQSRRSWLLKCLRFLEKYYGVAPVEVLYKLFSLKSKESIDDMIKLLGEMPILITETWLLPTKATEINSPAEGYDPLYTQRGLLAVHISMMEKDVSTNVLEDQGYIDYYIPSVQQIEDNYNYGYEPGTPAYRKLNKFLQREYGMSYESAFVYTIEVAKNNYNDYGISGALNSLLALGLKVRQGRQLEQLLDLLDDACDSTRLKEYRGYTDNEADKFITEDDESLTFKDQKVSSTVRVKRKIYPNDPCPCGSGKKYKKCCGRN